MSGECDKWMDIKKNPPKEFTRILVRTECADCPPIVAEVVFGSLVSSVIITCEKHRYSKNFKFLSAVTAKQIDDYMSRVTEYLYVVDNVG